MFRWIISFLIALAVIVVLACAFGSFIIDSVVR